MKLSKFNQFVFESSNDLPPAVKLAKLGLADGLRVLEWWTEVEADASALLTVYWRESYNWPEGSDDDMLVETQFTINSSLGFIEKRLMRFAKSSGLDWVHDMDRDTWKKVK
jgi:hypothetical protein